MKVVTERVRQARLRAAQALLEDADENVVLYEKSFREGKTADYRLEMSAYLDLWKRVQKTATNDIHRYGGANERKTNVRP